MFYRHNFTILSSSNCQSGMKPHKCANFGLRAGDEPMGRAASSEDWSAVIKKTSMASAVTPQTRAQSGLQTSECNAVVTICHS